MEQNKIKISRILKILKLFAKQNTLPFFKDASHKNDRHDDDDRADKDDDDVIEDTVDVVADNDLRHLLAVHPVRKRRRRMRRRRRTGYALPGYLPTC